MAALFCIECGRRQPLALAKFCPYCGDELHKPVGEPPPSRALQQAEHGSPDFGAEAATTGPACDAAAGAIAAVASAVAEPAAAQIAPPETAQPRPDPFGSRLTATLDAKRWVPMADQASVLRRRLRLAVMLAAAVLASLIAGGGLWWWMASPAAADQDITVELLWPPAENTSTAGAPGPNPGSRP